MLIPRTQTVPAFSSLLYEWTENQQVCTHTLIVTETALLTARYKGEGRGREARGPGERGARRGGAGRRRGSGRRGGAG